MIGKKISYPGYFTSDEISWCDTNSAYVSDINIVFDNGKAVDGYYEIVANQALTLDEFKTQRWEEIKYARDKAEQSGFEYLDKVFDSDETSVTRINSACINAQAAITTNTEFEIEWTTKDNTTVILSAQQMLGCAVALAQHSNQCHVHGRELRDMIDAATSKVELEAIVW